MENKKNESTLPDVAMTDKAKEARRAYQKAWRAANRDKVNQYQRDWRASHAQANKAAQKRYRDSHKEAIRERNALYWQNKAEASNTDNESEG